jgi:hypothetical protein
MMNYKERDAARAAALAILPAVLAAGERAGYWTALPRDDDDEHRDGDARVAAPDGSVFRLCAGGWGNEGKITADLRGHIYRKPFTVHVSDVRGYGGSASVSAAAAWERGAESVAKDLNRRCITNPTNLELAAKMRAEIEHRFAQRAALDVHIATLTALGFHSHGAYGRGDQDDYYASVRMGGPLDVELSASGGVRLMYPPTVSIDKLPALLAIIKD